MLLNPEVLTLTILNMIFAFFATIAFFLSAKIYLFWDMDSTSKAQYTLEKQSYLTSIIIKYIFIIKLPLFLFFIFTLDKISNVLTGAMCGAGVVDATSYGIYLFLLKIMNLYIFAYWLTLHYMDIKSEKLPYTKQKSLVFIFAFFLFISELSFEGLMFSDIDVDKMVSCCGTLYSSAATSYISNVFQIQTPLLLALFYGTFVLMLINYFFKNKYMFSLLNIIFLLVSLSSLIVFFGTYIYELPTHHCPFCMLQKDYNYVGYVLYSFLFVGTFKGIVLGFINKVNDKDYSISIIFDTLYMLTVTYYPLSYYLKNGLFL